MQHIYYIPTHTMAAPYGSCAYNSSQYTKNGEVCGATTTNGASGSAGGGNSGGLANTGVWVLGFAVLATMILLAALVVRVWRRPATSSKPK